ncbi:MAG: hypothetical protein JXA20_16880 [Spirochaetes bacterium]|nr:hypothetical protein [Spirochaetota bacterium]
MSENERYVGQWSLMTQSLVAAVVIGLLSAIIGSFSVGDTLMNSVLAARETFDPLQQFIAGPLFLLACKILLDLVFSLAGLLLLFLSGRAAQVQFISLVTGILQASLLLLHMALFWDRGWSQILDPSGGFVAALVQMLLGFLQSFAFILAGMRR